MARPPTKVTKVRLNLEIAESVRETLERLKDRIGADSLTEVIRRSIHVFEQLLTATGKGGKVIIRDKNGDEREIWFAG